MGFMPIDVVDYVDFVHSIVELDILYELRFLPGAGYLHNSAQWTAFENPHGIGMIELRKMINEVGIDVPGVEHLGLVCKGYQLITAATGRQGFEVRLFIVKAGNTPRRGVDLHPERCVLNCRTV